MMFYVALGVLHAGTECAEHIHIIITSVKKADNVIPILDQSLSTMRFLLIKTSGNIGICHIIQIK